MRVIMHGHHATNLFSFLGSLDDRIAEIKATKPAKEQELRLALIQDVTDLMPASPAREKVEAAWLKVEAAWGKASAAREKAEAAREKAEAAREKAWAAWETSFDVAAFHTAHCHPNCPWDGKTIFARGKGIEVLEEVQP